MTMTSYKRRNRPFWNSGIPTKVDIYWSQQYNAFAIKWHDTHHFGEMSPVISYFKSKPYGDCVYDPDNRIWYFKEDYLLDVRAMLAAFGNTIFDIKFQEKPQQNHSFIGSFGAKTITAYFNDFFELTGEYLKDMEYIEAKKVYRKVCLRLHPDHNPNVDRTLMSSVNECWSMLEQLHYKTKQEQTYESQI